VKLVGTIHLVLKDDAGKTWSYDIPDVIYDPESNSLLEMMKQMNLMNKHGYNPHQQPPFSNGTMANINGTLNIETPICANY
jgi:hypothetical protein